ncbi:cellulose biosynthesis protein BcsO [Kosakonia pseudosacchari]|uniref:Cellulose biosynthesis protein BcsO n=1 Tax=Kosakonia pseudosacchari TaxID=1646340 RepID=A0ABX4IVC5_9ENTR|nr:cellulose biosynthesis protein BcsO [Kosakonia pseudosacchari]PDO89145.1 cellulose biosynthesis protein BcsO [Kosakonia pseudosacchari]
MGHYDDLQRFKDKTRNQKHDFKDLSAQNLAHDQSNWVIINQLSPATDESMLAMGGHVSLPVPQSVDPALFAAHEPAAAVDDGASAPAPASAPTPSLLKDVASQLDAVAPAFNAAAYAPAPASVAPVMQMPAPADPASVPVSYARLFAAKAAEEKPRADKNQPLHSLLERIASCR